METNSTYVKVKELRNKEANDAYEYQFSKTMFGGYNCKEVEDYIGTLRNNMQISQKAFEEKLEEYSSASNMYLLERSKLIGRAEEAEKAAERIKSEKVEINKTEKAALQQLKEENERLKLVSEELQRQIYNLQSENSSNESEELIQSNNMLKKQVNDLIEEKDNYISENSVLTGELGRLNIVAEKLKEENEKLKKTVNSFKILRRNDAMNTNMKIFEYKQNNQLALDTIGNNIGEAIRALNTMQSCMHELVEKTKINVNAEDPADL